MITHDITKQFRTAADLIPPGTLIKDDHFSLFEAVGALEIGDAKMDSGCLLPGETLEDQYDFQQPLLPEELIWLMDQLLTREVAWLIGYPLSQTLFASVHIDRLLWPDPKALDECSFYRTNPGNHEADLSHTVLRAFCLLLIKSCDLVLTMVTSQHYYEEEDLTTQLFNRELLHRFSSQSIIKEAENATRELGSSKISADLQAALLVRIRIRCNILQMLVHHTTGNSVSNDNFGIMHMALDNLRSTNSLGMSLADAFSTKLQRRLASTVPPRPMVTVSTERVWEFWHLMLRDCQDVFSIFAANHSQDLLNAYQLFAFHPPQASTYPRALLQFFLTLDGKVCRRLKPHDFLEEDLRSLTLPTSPLLSTSNDDYGPLYFGKQEISDHMQSFYEKMEHYFVIVYRAFCLNSCRIRRTFCHALIEWDGIQGEMEEVDSFIQSVTREQQSSPPGSVQPSYSYSLSSWVYHHKLTLHRLTIQMGFQQMIYAPHELAGMHWYLSSICEIHLGHLERMCHFVIAKDTDVKTGALNTATQAKDASECKSALDRLFRLYSIVKATNLLASTLHLIFVVLRRLGVFRCSEPLYSSNHLRHEIRMKPFLNLAVPENPSSAEFDRGSSMSSVRTEDLLETAKALSAQAKKAWEEISKTRWNVFPLKKVAPRVGQKVKGDIDWEASALEEKWETDVKNSIRASIAAGLAVTKMKNSINDSTWRQQVLVKARLPEPGEKERWHQWWIVPSLP